MLSHTPAFCGKTPVIRAMHLAIRLSFNPQRSRGERSSPLNRRPKTKSFHPLGSKSSMPFLESRTKEWLKTFVGLERTILSTRSSPFLPVSTIGGFPCAVSSHVYLNSNTRQAMKKDFDGLWRATHWLAFDPAAPVNGSSGCESKE